MKIIEFIHDDAHPEESNIDLWVKKNSFSTKKVYIYKNSDLPDYSSYDLLLLHGGAQHLWAKADYPWLKKEIAYVKKTLELKKPVIGFCLGSQILAEALGSNVFKADISEIGWYGITPRLQSKKNTLLYGLEDGFETFLWHSDHYHLPANCESLAFTKAAQHQIFVSTIYPAVAYQFHPEYTKEIISHYCETFYDSDWKGIVGDGDKDIFLQGLERRTDTLPLFEELMTNALDWFSVKFTTR